MSGQDLRGRTPDEEADIVQAEINRWGELADENDRLRAALADICAMVRSSALSDMARDVLRVTAVPVAREALEGPADA